MKVSTVLSNMAGLQPFTAVTQGRRLSRSSTRPLGVVRFEIFEGSRLIASIEDHNLFVNAGLPALAALMGGTLAESLPLRWASDPAAPVPC